MTDAKHTLEPWAAQGWGSEWFVQATMEDDQSDAVAVREIAHVHRGMDAQRIVACVNALAGLDPAAVGDVVAALDSFLDGTVRPYVFGPNKQKERQEQEFHEKIVDARTALARLRGEATS